MPPRGKVPFITHGDRLVADSGSIFAYLTRTFGNADGTIGPKRLRASSSLPAERAAKLHAVRRMLESHTYFAACQWVFMEPAGWAETSRITMPGVPEPMRSVLKLVMRRGMYDGNQAAAGGIGRKTWREVEAEIAEDLQAVAALLGDGPYVGGDVITDGELPILAALWCFRYPLSLDSPLGARFAAHPSLVAYAERGARELFADRLAALSH